MKDYYKILDLKEQATLNEVKSAYRKLSKKYHPDANSGNKSFVELFRDVQEAYDVLSDEPRRTAYNQELKYYKFQLNTEKSKIAAESGERKAKPFGKEVDEKWAAAPQPISENSYARKYAVLAAAGLILVLSAFFLPKKTSLDRTAAVDTVAVMNTPVALSVSQPNIEEQKKYWHRLSGQWAGSGKEKTLKKTFAIKLLCDFEKNKFSIEYPDLRFSGSWQLIETDNDRAIFKETLETGLLNYTKGGSVELTVMGEDTFEYKYYFPDEHHLLAEGTLERIAKQ